MQREHVDTHPGIAKVDFRDGDFASQLLAAKDFKDGEVIARFDDSVSGPRAYSSVQVSKDKHIEFNSDLLYMNHSCAPNAIVDVSKWEVRAGAPITKGTPITFFYPSTEWEMAQPFKCKCGAKNCLGTISGAKYIPRHVLRKYALNQHIKQYLYDSAATHRGDAV